MIKLDGSDSNGYNFSRKSSAIFQPSFAELIITASSGTYWSIRGLMVFVAWLSEKQQIIIL
jgi:hypothetical protein